MNTDPQKIKINNKFTGNVSFFNISKKNIKSGASLTKKLPSIFSSPKKPLIKCVCGGDENPNKFFPKKNWVLASKKTKKSVR